MGHLGLWTVLDPSKFLTNLEAGFGRRPSPRFDLCRYLATSQAGATKVHVEVHEMSRLSREGLTWMIQDAFGFERFYGGGFLVPFVVLKVLFLRSGSHVISET